MTFSRTEESFFKQLNESVRNKNCPNFLYMLYIAQRKSKPSFSNSLLAVIPLLVMQ